MEDKTIPHSIILITGKINALKGTATDGSLNSLLTVCESADAYLNEGEPGNAETVHEKLEEIQTWLETAEPCVADFETDLAGMI